jgi:nicotinamidase-related amidase
VIDRPKKRQKVIAPVARRVPGRASSSQPFPGICRDPSKWQILAETGQPAHGSAARESGRESCSTDRLGNTDVDLQLKQFGISRVVSAGIIVNTCTEATGRFAAELGYHVTGWGCATAAVSPETMQAADAFTAKRPIVSSKRRRLCLGHE